MALRDQLKKQKYQEIWQQYCGFLDLSMDGYMKIQRRLMEEQIRMRTGPVYFKRTSAEESGRIPSDGAAYHL